MNEKTSQLGENRTTKVYLLLAISFSVAGWILYLCFGHLLIKAMYEGRAVSILSNLVKYQYKKPVDHYLDLADTVFFKAFLLFWIGFFLLIAVRSFLAFAKKKQWLSSESLFHINVIYFTSLGIRIVFLPFVFNLPTAGDEKYYLSMPRWLANGDFISTVLRPPLWGYLMVIPALIAKYPIAFRTFTALIGALAPILVYFLANKIFDRRTGFVAGLIYALYPEHIAYSHYLWSEVLFGILCLLSVYFFFVFVNNQQKPRYLFLSFFSVGVALMTKEFALILFVGLLFTFFSLKPNKVLKRVSVCCILFFLPAITYSIAISLVTDSVIILNDAPVGNFREAAELELHFVYSFEDREDSLHSLVSFLKNRNLSETLKSTKTQFYNLWTPNSFPVIRLLSIFKPESWSYGISRPWPWAVLVIGYYILVIIIGITGLCLTENKVYLAFSVTSLVCLSLTSILALLCSRFRLPFMFIFVIYSAYLLTNVKSLAGNLKKPIRVITLGLLLVLFAHIIYVKWPTLGLWG